MHSQTTANEYEQGTTEHGPKRKQQEKEETTKACCQRSVLLPSGSKLCGCARRPEGLCWAKNNFQAGDPNSAQRCQAVPVLEQARVAKLKITYSREIFFSQN